MSKINLYILRDRYSKIKDRKSKNIGYKDKAYFELSIFNNRDIFEFDSDNFDLIKELKFDTKNSSKSDLFFSKYIKNQNEYKYLLKKRNILNYLILLCKYIFFTIDIILIIFISILKIITRKNKILKQKLKEHNIYSIYYWKSKRNDSIYYYYPHLKAENNYLCIVTTFVDIKFFSLGLIGIKNERNIITPIDIIRLNDLLKSIFILFDIFLKDISNLKEFSISKILKIFISWSHISKIYYNILIYLALERLSSHNEYQNYINWGENQNHLKAFALGIIKGRKDNKNLSTFIGSPISINYRNHLIPNKREFYLGIWGKNIILQTEECLKELKNFVNRKDIKIDLDLCPPEMLRSSLTFKSSKDYKSKKYTIFTHDSYWDLESCFKCLYQFLKPNKTINDEKLIIYIRLHPTLKVLTSKRKLLDILKLDNSINISFEFIKEGSIRESINTSDFCIFGESSYINYAISKNKNILCCLNNHRYKPPIYENFLNYKKIKFLDAF